LNQLNQWLLENPWNLEHRLRQLHQLNQWNRLFLSILQRLRYLVRQLRL
jgi:hypothetical protein